jgi:uncharacterized protein YigA (DUF484 family)
VTTGEVSTWLQLLDEHRPVEAIDDLRHRLVAAGADPAAVDAEATRARRIGRQLADRKQHVDELTVLDDLARRLTTLRDPREVLDEVSAQARRLLSADVAYLMLVQPDGTLRTEVVSGSFGTALQGIVLNRGTGMAGEVLRTGRPWTSEDYLSDSAFPHVAAIDLAASSEHLGGLLAVPLLIGGDTIGVLCASARERRLFGNHEIELSSRLASHAAVAISNARLFEQYRTAVRDLKKANASLRRTVASRQQANDLRDRLTLLMIEGAKLAGLVTELRRSIGGRLAVFDAEDTLLDGDAGVTLQGLTGGSTGREISASSSTQLSFQGPSGPALVAKIGLTTGYAGCLVSVANTGEERTDDLAGLLAVGATSLALYVASQRSISEAELRTRGEFLSALLSTDVPEGIIRRRAGTARINIDQITAVAVFDLDGRDARAITGLAHRLTDDLAGWSAEHGGLVVALLTAATPEDTRTCLTRLAGSDLPTTVGIEASVGGVASVRNAFEVAHQTVTVLKALGRDGDCALAAELGMYRSLFGAAGRGEIRTFVEHTVGALLEHDRRHGSDLVLTLGTFLAIGQNHTRAATELHVHPNTLYRRLDRVTALLGDDWRTAPRTLEVQLALHLLDLLGKV